VKKLQGLDALRGLLALVVCGAHSYTIFVRPYSLTRGFINYFWVLSARFAVLLFFILSGFVIAYSITSNIKKNNGYFYIREFTISRIARIAPGLIAAIIIVIFLSQILGWFGLQVLPQGVITERTVFKPDVLAQIASLFTIGLLGKLSGGLNGPLWSLIYEIQLYVISALFTISLIGYAWQRLIAFPTLIILMICLFLVGNMLQLICFINFLIGAITFLYLDKIKSFNLIITAILCAFAFMLLVVHSNLNDFDKHAFGIISQIFFTIPAASCLQLITRFTLLDRLKYLGKFSYSLYVIHFPLLLFLFFMLQPFNYPILTAIFAFIGSINISIILAHYLENTVFWRKKLTQTLAIVARSLRTEDS